MSAIPSAVVVEQLSKSFGHGDLAVHAVRDVDLRIAGGEVVLIMGPSGSGKTTLLLMLGAMLRPTSGSVVIDGIDLATAPERELPTLRARHLGFVFQDFNLLSALTARENVELACNLGGTTGSKARDRAAHSSSESGSPTEPSSVPISCPVARSSGSPSPEHWPTTPACCSPTSRRRTSTRATGATSVAC